MTFESFYDQVRTLLDRLYQSTGYPLDTRLTGYAIGDAVHVNIDPAMEALVRTEHRISPRMSVDLRELVLVAPPVAGGNLFVTFSAHSAQFMGGNASAFGIHFTEARPPLEEQRALDEGIFVPGAQVTDVYRLVVFLQSPDGDVTLARTGVSLGLDANARLIAYQTFQFNPGLTVIRHAPSSLAEADSQVMLYIFLTLSVFLMTNQGEAPLRWQDDQTVVIG
jgi:hypothetical protein